MGKRRQPSLAVEPFPPLAWDGFFWAGTVLLPAWKGFQDRRGPYASRKTRKPSDGTTRLTIASPSEEGPAPPSAEQAAAYRYLTAHQEAVRDSILGAVFDEYPDYRA